jgi:hypothetical protein
VVFSDCKKNPIAPPTDTPGRRDYTWFIDTIYAGGNIISSIDGVSTSDVWVTSVPGSSSQIFYHFDGTKWSTDNVNRSFDPERIRAVASNSVWSVGFSGDIWHYDGNQWGAQAKLTADSNFVVGLESIDGDSPIDLFVVGEFFAPGDNMHPLIYHLSGNTWYRIGIQDLLDCNLYKIRFYSPGKALILAGKHLPDGSAPDSSKIFAFESNSLREIYSNVAGQDGYGDFAPVPNGIIIAKGRNLFLDNRDGETFITKIQNSYFLNGVEARNEKDIIIAMTDGIAQYNGADVQYLYHFLGTSTRIYGMKLFTNGAFIVARDLSMNTNYIYRGYLN